jgi:hypothetical protein
MIPTLHIEGLIPIATWSSARPADARPSPLPLLVAAIAGSAAAAIAARASRRYTRAAAVISLAGIALFAVGVRFLVLAASLPRSERPQVVMPGMALAALGLVLVPCVIGRRMQTRVA